MSNKKETPVSWLFKEIKKDILGLEYDYSIELQTALQMESQKQQKYDEMLAILEKHLIFHNAEMECLQQPSSEMWFDLYEKTEQLIKEAKEL
jgi:hypothetical protein